MLTIFLIVLLQFNFSNGFIFLPVPKEWKLPDLNVLNRPLKKSILNLDEHWRTWLLTHSNVSDLQFQQSLDLNLTVVERSTHVLTRQILTEFPTMILIGGYVRDVVINNEKSFNNQLEVQPAYFGLPRSRTTVCFLSKAPPIEPFLAQDG